MAGILRKFASAFVVLDDANSTVEAHPDLEDVTRDAAQLLAQLEGGTSASPGLGAENTPSSGAMAMTAQQVFQSKNLEDGPNAAPRLLKIIAGLSMFPREQQLMMVRAMDAADDSWTEQEVLNDATTRYQVLEQHLLAIAAEREANARAIDQQIQQTQEGGRAVLQEIDGQIASLYARREKEAAETTTVLAQLDGQKQELLRQDERARQGIQQVLQALTGLITFFGAAPLAPKNPPAPRPGS